MTLVTNVSLPAAMPPRLIVFGRDQQQRPHASKFAADDKAQAERAAALMGMHILEIGDDDHRSLAAQLPQGRLFESGKAFVPFVKNAVFDQLVAAAGLPDAGMPLKATTKGAGVPPAAGGGADGDSAPGGPGGPRMPGDWADIGRGSLVLACAGPMEGWFEAVVVYTKANDAFELRWRDWPDEPLVTKQRKDLGLMPPDSTEGMK